MAKIELLVSTMHQNKVDIVKSICIQSDALLINQAEMVIDVDREWNGFQVRMRSFCERGISRSRNRALDQADAKICHIADDDFRCDLAYKEKILQAYEEHSEFDIIVFKVPNLEEERNKDFPKRKKRVGFIRSMKVSSSEITFRLDAIKKADIRFREDFGVGSGDFGLGEENIFLFDCLRKGLKIMYSPLEIGIVGTRASTWYKGLNREYLYARGASFAAMSERYAWLLILQYGIRKHKEYCRHLTMREAYSQMIKGRRDYLVLNRRRIYE